LGFRSDLRFSKPGPFESRPRHEESKLGAQTKVLVIAEAVTLAHVGRSIRLASILHREGIDVELACDPRYDRFLSNLDFPVRSIRSIPTDVFLDALAHGRPVFSVETLRGYVSGDLALFETSQPDLVVGDFRLSLSVSARIARIPYVNVTNAYWSPYARPRFRMPSLPFERLLSAGLADAAFAIARPLAFAAHAWPLNRVRRAYGLPALGWDVRHVYCDGDLTLYADIPDLIPVFSAPTTHRYIGPVLWSPAVDPPEWWNEVSSGQPPIYVSLGSSGPSQLLPMVIEALAPLGRPIVVATAGRGAELPRRAKLWVTDFVPGEILAAKACAVVCNGGSPTTQQALLHGIPVIGIASNLDQLLNMDYIERFGAGALVRADRAQVKTIREATRHAIDDAQQRERARSVAALAAINRPEVQLPAAVRFLLDAVPRTSQHSGSS
jgi:UDP:flavonoid glycosyltransferase YjiC (YdhE family)